MRGKCKQVQASAHCSGIGIAGIRGVRSFHYRTQGLGKSSKEQELAEGDIQKMACLSYLDNLGSQGKRTAWFSAKRLKI